MSCVLDATAMEIIGKLKVEWTECSVPLEGSSKV